MFQGKAFIIGFILTLAAFGMPAGTCCAQDTVKNNNAIALNPDTVIQKKQPYQPNPKKSGMYSAILPGLGQLYNRQYWKIPVIYTGLAVAGYFFINNLDNYQSYRLAYIGRINNPYPTDKYVGLYTTAQLQQLQDDYNKYLDLTVMISVIGYSMQIIDAITSAHLKNFDIGRDISVKLKPMMLQNGIGFGLAVSLKDKKEDISCNY